MVWTSESSWQCKEEMEKDDYKLELRVQLLTDYGTHFNLFPVLVSNCLIDLFSHLPGKKVLQVPSPLTRREMSYWNQLEHVADVARKLILHEHYTHRKCFVLYIIYLTKGM